MTFAEALRQRTFAFARRVVALAYRLPADWQCREIGRQLLRSGTSVAANDRGACRGRSRREFTAKLGVAVEEADETAFWLDLIAATQSTDVHDIQELRAEARELLAILARSHRTARENRTLAE